MVFSSLSPQNGSFLELWAQILIGWAGPFNKQPPIIFPLWKLGLHGNCGPFVITAPQVL